MFPSVSALKAYHRYCCEVVTLDRVRDGWGASSILLGKVIVVWARYLYEVMSDLVDLGPFVCQAEVLLCLC